MLEQMGKTACYTSSRSVLQKRSRVERHASGGRPWRGREGLTYRRYIILFFEKVPGD